MDGADQKTPNKHAPSCYKGGRLSKDDLVNIFMAVTIKQVGEGLPRLTIKGRQDRNSNRQGLMQRPMENAAFWFIPHACFLIKSRTIIPKIRKCVTDFLQPDCQGIFFIEGPSFQTA